MKAAGLKRAPRGGSALRPVSARSEDWRGETLARIRAVVMGADPGVFEEVKWRKPSNAMRGVPVWSHARCGIICTGETYKGVVKVTFARGASLEDPAGLFNASLEGGARRAIDVREGEKVDAVALAALVRAAIAAGAAKPRKGSKAAASRAASEPVLLAGGNPQIAKGDGEGPVRAYIDAMPGWKREVGRRLDALIVEAVPGVRKAVRWNSPLYGAEGRGWFLGVHCYAKCVKVMFFQGASLLPMPPGVSRTKGARWLDIREGEPLDEGRFKDWVRQASVLEGWNGR